MTTCDWCLQEAPLQIIQEELWYFWKIVSREDSTVTYYKNICKKCVSRYEDFSIYIERCKIHALIIDDILSGRNIRNESSIDIEYRPLIKEEISEEAPDSNHPTVPDGVVISEPGCSKFPSRSEKFDSNEEVLSFRRFKEELSVDIDDHLIIENDVCRENVSHPDHHSACNSKGRVCSVLKVVLKREVFPEFMTFQKKPNNNCACLYCDENFNYPSHLKRHLRIHTGEEPFKCSLCNKASNQSGTLKYHMHLHSGEKPFKCSLCNKAFNQSGVMFPPWEQENS